MENKKRFMKQERRSGSAGHPNDKTGFSLPGSLQSTPAILLNVNGDSAAAVLESPRNHLIQAIRYANQKGVALENGLVVIEGPHLLEEALDGPWEVEQVLVSNSAIARWNQLSARLTPSFKQRKCPVTVTSDRAFDSAADTQHSQGILGLVRPHEWSWAEITGGRRLVVVLDAVRDPGNAGTILRSAEAFGASGIIALQGSVQFTNGKFLRAAAGSVFRLPLISQISASEMGRQLADAGVVLYGLAAGANRTLLDVDFEQPCALAVGSEGAGLSDAVRELVEPVSIPTEGVESLNAAVACSIALFEAARQRARKVSGESV
jgi:RNA methyltransferase, TrmH family